MYIRVEQDKDIEAISDVVYAAFLNHPQHVPGALPHEPKLVNMLRSAGGRVLGTGYRERGRAL